MGCRKVIFLITATMALDISLLIIYCFLRMRFFYNQPERVLLLVILTISINTLCMTHVLKKNYVDNVNIFILTLLQSVIVVVCFFYFIIYQFGS
jgi:hypothetical protein